MQSRPSQNWILSPDRVPENAGYAIKAQNWYGTSGLRSGSISAAAQPTAASLHCSILVCQVQAVCFPRKITQTRAAMFAFKVWHSHDLFLHHDISMEAWPRHSASLRRQRIPRAEIASRLRPKRLQNTLVSLISRFCWPYKNTDDDAPLGPGDASTTTTVCMKRRCCRRPMPQGVRGQSQPRRRRCQMHAGLQAFVLCLVVQICLH